MNQKLYKQFYTALQESYSHHVTHLITVQGLSVNYQFWDGRFPLHIAAEKQDLDMVKMLLQLRASPDLKNSHGESALLTCVTHIARAERGVQIVHALLSTGAANVNSYDSHKRTALHLAAAKGRASVVLTLLDAGARADSLDAWRRTPLHVALLNIPHSQPPPTHSLEVIKMLIGRKCDVNRRDCHQATPLFLAVNHGDACLELVRTLLNNGAHPDRTSRHKLTPIMLAVLKGYEAAFKLLLSYNCNITVKYSTTGRSCLYTALGKGFENIARLLVAAGYPLHEERWLFDSNIVEQVAAKFPHMSEYLQELSCTPLKLKTLSRGAIRQWYGLKLPSIIRALCYPSALKAYILLEGDMT